MAIGCDTGAGRATSSGMGTVLTRRFRCPGENWKSGSGGFRAETHWRPIHSEWSPLLTISVHYQQSRMVIINSAPLPGAPSGNFVRYQLLHRSL